MSTPSYEQATQKDNNNIFAIFLSGKNEDETDWDGLKIQGSVVATGELEIKNDVGNPVPISAESLPLPASASTAANQATSNIHLQALNTILGTTGDAAVASDAIGTISGKLRGLVKIFANVWDSVNGWLKTEEQMAPVAEDNDAGVFLTEERYSTVAIEANATTTHVTGAGFLKAVVITDRGATSNTLNIYDNTAGSGTKIISQIDMDNSAEGYYPVNREFTTGLTTVLATGTAGKLYLIFEDRSA